MHRTIAVIALLAASTATPALAQDTGETTREVVGWTPEGEIAVRAISQGERVVEGSSKSYYFEVDEAWEPTLGTPESRHRRGEATGFEHPTWKKADPAPLAIEPWTTGTVSPDDKHLLVTLTREERRTGDEGWVCTVTARTILMSRDSRAAFAVGSTRATGAPATRESGADCPRVATRVGWSAESKKFVVERRLGDGFGFVAGSTSATGDYAEAPLRTHARLDPLGSLPVGPSRNAWEAILDADVTATRSALTGDYESTAWTQLALAWAAGRAGDASTATKIARKVERDVAKDPIGLAMLGGAYALAGDTRRVKTTLNKALQAADDWQVFVRMALLLEDIDLSLFNQVLVYGLSSKSGKADAEPWAWRALIDGLVDAGLAEKGKELLTRIPEENPAHAGARARLAVGARDATTATSGSAELLWADIGNCDAYLLAGRARLLAGAPADALPLLDAALFCDPNAAEAAYFLAELHRAAGRLEPTLTAAKAYLQAAPPRRSDEVRAARRARTQKVIDRLSNDGIALMSLSCRALGPAFLCQGRVANRSRTPIEAVTAKVMEGETLLGETTIESIPAGEIRSFGVRVEKLDGTRLELGRDEVERALNAEEELRLGW